MTSHDLLLEIGTEELPPKSLQRLVTSLASSLAEQLRAAQFPFDDVETHATPRRLAVIVRALAERQPDQEIEKRGPALKAAYDEDGKPTRALEGFARANGIEDLSTLTTLETDKGAWVIYRATESGQPLATMISDMITTALDRLPIDRRMRWGSNRSEFVRPVHWLVLMHGSTVIDTSILGKTAGRETLGHRFMANQTISLDDVSEYEDALARHYVVTSFERRRAIIKGQIAELAASLNATLADDDALLDEVTALTEWPVALAGNFSERFLEVPEEALISAMREHQRYFHLRSPDGDMLPAFITIANIESSDPATVIKGNERVILPRLSDAAFFYQKDQDKPLADNISRLENVVFQSKLGSFADKARRVASLAGALAEQLGANSEHAQRAGLLCKADLVTDMVGEFPDLQGIMGSYYAASSGEPADVCSAIREHYQPTHAGGPLPTNDIASCVAVADKLDTVVGLFGIGEPPTGSKDPFAIRRQCLGIIRICIENTLDLDFSAAVQQAIDGHNTGFTAEPVLEYLFERLGQWYVDQGISADNFTAVRQSTAGIGNLLDVDNKVRAIANFRQHEQASDLIAANKRVSNILKKSAAEKADTIVDSLFDSAAEHALMKAITDYNSSIKGQKSYNDSLEGLARMQPVVNQYFDDVMVMADDSSVRANRLATLAELRSLFVSVADFSHLQT